MAVDRTTYLQAKALEAFKRHNVPLDGWNWTDRQMRQFLYGTHPRDIIDEVWGYLEYPFTFLHFAKSGTDIMAEYDTYGMIDVQRKWAAEWALLRGEPVPAEVLTRYGLTRPESEAT